ncbi:MAG TPA: thioredoxin [Actinomycetota bacterium]|nr:thioredoxin [Actinomycetota bacterium]
MKELDRPAAETSNEGHFPSLAGATGWLNSPPLDPAGLRGRVVVVDFCTYTCINWLRTLAYVRAWEERYRHHGLVLIGVHTPEFSFEHDVDNVREALASMRVGYPIALDNDYGVWDAFANRYWPALYFIDAGGRIRHHRFGEGDEERSERVIQELLAETGATDVGTDLVAVAPTGPEVAADWDELGSSETYLGSERSQGFASPGGITPERSHRYTGPDRLPLNRWSLTGDWTAHADRVSLDEPGGRIDFAFHARDVHLVMGPRDPGTTVAFRVTIDGEHPAEASGADVDADGAGSLVQQRMYQLVRQTAPIRDRVFSIRFEGRGAEAFAFTFG